VFDIAFIPLFHNGAVFSRRTWICRCMLAKFIQGKRPGTGRGYRWSLLPEPGRIYCVPLDTPRPGPNN
ncbi:MAG TPA: hypothetical protein PKY10_15335, partial [Lentisphaeria bacterium]|nr:hypothetical protein [Lentisphaeria bacterium]